MALQLVHSARRAEEPDSATEPALSLIQGGRDPAAEEAARVAAIYKARDEEVAKIRARSAESKRLHDELMEQLRAGHAARMKAMDDDHAMKMAQIRKGGKEDRRIEQRLTTTHIKSMGWLLIWVGTVIVSMVAYCMCDRRSVPFEIALSILILVGLGQGRILQRAL